MNKKEEISVKSEFKCFRDLSESKEWISKMYENYQIELENHTFYQVYESENGEFHTYYGVEIFYN